MPRDVDQQALLERFSRKYRVIRSPLLQRLERAACGSDYGATSYTTLEQARELRSRLALQPGEHLLEVGAGSGWPGLFLAKESGCKVTLTDMPLEGLQVARQRAAGDGLNRRCSLAVASAAALPFRAATFDAISHADVLCCLPEKREALKACRDVIKPGGRMLFSVILVTPGLGKNDYRQAVACGPTFIAADEEYPALLRAAGWNLTEQIDLTTEFTKVLRIAQELDQRYGEELEQVLGPDEVARRQARHRENLIGVERGWLRRELFAAAPA